MNEINERVLYESKIMLQYGKTIREVSQYSKVSKSTVHDDLTKKLLKIDKKLYGEIRKILEYHKIIRHLNGGLATKLKYENLRKIKWKMSLKIINFIVYYINKCYNFLRWFYATRNFI